MKKIAFLIAVVAALAFAAPALAGTTTINVTATSFNPQEVEIRPGDTVTWKNTDTANHQIISDTGEFKSDVLQPGESYSFVFETQSSYSYHDGMDSDRMGFIHVLSTKVTLGITQITAIYGSSIRVFGGIPGDNSGSVTIHITPYRGRRRRRPSGRTPTVRTRSGTGRGSARSSTRRGTARLASRTGPSSCGRWWSSSR